MDAENSWRAILAALANDTVRSVYAELVTTGTSATLERLSPSRRRHVRGTLKASGLVDVDDDDRLRPVPDVFGRALRAAPTRPRADGVQRYLDEEGRIRAYPADGRARRELLAWIARQTADADEVLTEREINDRLARFTTDVALLRRSLVDHELMERTPTGSEYVVLVAD